jgi:hypothetical protein
MYFKFDEQEQPRELKHPNVNAIMALRSYIVAMEMFFMTTAFKQTKFR